MKVHEHIYRHYVTATTVISGTFLALNEYIIIPVFLGPVVIPAVIALTASGVTAWWCHEQYEKYTKGPVGPAGKKGDVGHIGASGFPGKNGDPGHPGNDGVDGLPGKDGHLDPHSHKLMCLLAQAVYLSHKHQAKYHHDEETDCASDNVHRDASTNQHFAGEAGLYREIYSEFHIVCGVH